MKLIQSYKTKLRLTIVIFSFLPAYSQAQESGKSAAAEWGADVHYGYLLRATTEELKNFNYTAPVGLRISYIRQTLGKKTWHALYNYPRIGFFLDYTDSRSSVLGKSLSAVSYLDFVSARTPKFEWGAKLGTGLCFAFSPYDREKNPENYFWGTHLNVVMYGSLYARCKLSRRFSSEIGLELNHASNGSFQKPNFGVNNVNVYAGLIYRPYAEQTVFGSAPLLSWSRRWRCYAGFSFGLKEIYPIGGRKYPSYLGYFSVGKRVSALSELHAGLDFLVNTSLKEEISRSLPAGSSDAFRPDYKRVGLTLGHELIIGRLSLLTQLGVYIYKPYKAEPPIYQRYGLRYYFHDKMYAGIALKTHYANADVIELGTGFRF